MAIIMTGAGRSLAYWSAGAPQDHRSFSRQGQFRRPNALGFARLSFFGANGNHAPSGFEGAVTSDLGLELLFNIAGSR